jgi:demethylmenaquinone methyltransferase / 2-methoxy-6-polyprenyl-1,4-benzoquinol methylase
MAMDTTVKPYSSQGGKREQVERMFDGISPKYDLLNRLCSLGVDQLWRKRVVAALREEPVQRLLDVATGTADLALMAAAHVPEVVGVDISAGMLEHGQRKVVQRQLEHRVHLRVADAQALPFPSDSFDAVTVAFGVRNFENLDLGLVELNRVLRPDGRLLVLEFGVPQRMPLRQLFRFYFHRIMPLIGRLVSRDVSAYSYLPKSVDAFPSSKEFLERTAAAGFAKNAMYALSGGIAMLYVSRK